MKNAWPAALLLAVLLPAQRDRTAAWEHLKKSYDKDGDGKITVKEYPRGEKSFKNLDRNGDGNISLADFEGRSRGRQRSRPASEISDTARQIGDMFGSFINTDGKPGITKIEWQEVITKLGPDEKGVIASDNLPRLLGKAGEGRMARFVTGRMRRLFDVDEDRTVTVKEVDSLFAKMDTDGNGTVEQGTEISMPPGVGEVAPDFTLPFMKDGKKTLTLSSHRGKKPVCLIFGSYT